MKKAIRLLIFGYIRIFKEKKVMFLGEKANFIDYLRYFLKIKGVRAGICPPISTNNSFVQSYITPYNELQASTRFRANDIIFYSLNSKKYNIRFFNPFEKYDILIFQMNFSKKAYQIASSYKRRGTKIILDIVENFFDKSKEQVQKKERKEITRFVKIIDKIITPSNYIKNYIVDNGYFSSVDSIPEIIPDHFFKVKKKHMSKNETNLLYVGYTSKSYQLELIKEVLEQLNKEYKINLILICEKFPKLNIDIKQIFIKYNPFTISNDMLNGDIFINPRDLNDSYNLGHAFTKIGYPMSVGIPIVTSPIPSYLDSPAIFCDNEKCWYEKIKELIEKSELRSRLAKKGIKYCRKNYTKNVVMEKYVDCFNGMLDQ